MIGIAEALLAASGSQASMPLLYGKTCQTSSKKRREQ